MLTRARINKAVNDRLKGKFPGIPIQSTDIEEGFNRPSFFVTLETTRTEPSQFNVLREMTCRIRYFPSDPHEYKEEAYDAQDKLESLFGLSLEVDDRNITIGDAFTDTIDKVVHYDFSFAFYDGGIAEEEHPLMWELELSD